MDERILLTDELLGFPNSSSARDQRRQRIQIIEKGLRKPKNFFNAFFCKVVLLMRGYVPIQPYFRRPFRHGRRNTVLARQLGEPTLELPGFIHAFCREVQSSAAKNDAGFVMTLPQVEHSLLEGFGDPRGAIRGRSDSCKFGGCTYRENGRAVVVEIVSSLPALKVQVFIASWVESGNDGLSAITASEEHKDPGLGRDPVLTIKEYCVSLAIRTLEALHVLDHLEFPLIKLCDCPPPLRAEQASRRGYV